MKTPTEYPFTRYLAAKKTVDDRALNKTVWQSLTHAVSTGSSGAPLRILEIGAGIGTMVERVLDWGMTEKAEYLAIDSMEEAISEAAARVPSWARDNGFIVKDLGGRRRRITRKDRDFEVSFEAVDLFDFMARRHGDRGWDLIIANAFLDLVDVPATLPDLFSLLTPGGHFYFSVTFDGCTILQPAIDRVLDSLIEALYHETMDRRVVNGRPAGDSRTGRHFFHHVKAAGAELVDAGASDWVVFPGPLGYRGDEAFFLHFIIHTIATALHGHPALVDAGFDRWIQQRHSQVEQGTLVYIAHQMDFLGRISDTPAVGSEPG